MTTVIQAGQRITAALMQQFVTLEVIKSLDESLASSTAMQNDDSLFLAMAANTSYEFACFLKFDGGTAGASDLKWQWSVPTGTTMDYGVLGVGAGGGNWAGNYFQASSLGTGQTSGGGNFHTTLMTGQVSTGGTAGNLQLQWAQNQSSATPTTVRANSWLRLRPNP